MRKTILTLFSAAFLCLGLTSGLHAEKKAKDLTPYFKTASSEVGKPDKDGFVRRWLILEPIEKPNRSNTVFTDSYLREAFNPAQYSPQLTKWPKNGETIKVGKEKLQWHALDSQLFNVKLFRFSTKLEKPHYGVLYWVTTAIDCPEEIKDVRMSVGSNSASMWWLDGTEAVLLSGDRRMVQDDAMSRRITLKKGRNIILGAVINGPGMSDFCLRFLDENGNPVTNFTVSTL